MSAAHRDLKRLARTRDAAGGRNPFCWDQFDGLPPLIKQVMHVAPVCLGTDRAVRNLRRMSIEDAARAEIHVAREATQALLRTRWPAGHPMVRA